jgi:hypothetical protein
MSCVLNYHLVFCFLIYTKAKGKKCMQTKKKLTQMFLELLLIANNSNHATNKTHFTEESPAPTSSNSVLFDQHLPRKVQSPSDQLWGELSSMAKVGALLGVFFFLPGIAVTAVAAPMVLFSAKMSSTALLSMKVAGAAAGATAAGATASHATVLLVILSPIIIPFAFLLLCRLCSSSSDERCCFLTGAAIGAQLG